MKTAKRVLVAVFVLLVVLVMVGRRMNANKIGGQGPAEPFRIAGNFYYVGATDATAYLITGPEGHIVIDAGYPTTARLVIASIAKLGFDIKDVKILLNSEPHPDHGGGLSVLQEASGAQVWASEPSAATLAAGGNDRDLVLPFRILMWLGLVGYPPVRVDHIVHDGDTVRVGPIALAAHITGGHTRGCTSWSFQVQDGNRALNALSSCDIEKLTGTRYAEQDSDIVNSIRVLRSLPVDIWVTSHARRWGRYRKFAARDTARDSVAPFIDPAGYRAFLDTADMRLRLGLVH